MPLLFTDEQLIEAMKTRDYSDNSFSKVVGVSRQAVAKRRAVLAKRGLNPDYTGWQSVTPPGFYMDKKTIHTKADGTLIQQWDKVKIQQERQREILAEITEELVASLPSYPLTVPRNSLDYGDMLCVYPFGDPHIGMHAWADECGENWDLKLASDTFREMFDVILSKSPSCKVALLHFAGDTLHYDNMAGITSRSGNVLDCDGRYPKMVRVTTDITLNMINSLLQKHEKVVVNIDRGNHDDIGSVWIVEVIMRAYKYNPRVEIIDSQAPIHIYEFGKVLLASHHGHTIKMAELPITVASDFAEAWGRTKHRYGLTGHVHHDATISKHGQEFTGMYVESLRTLAPKDSYATWGGYRAKRDTKCIIYHKDLGEIERYTASIDALLLQTGRLT